MRVSGVAASQPAGVAVGTVAALSRASPSKPPGRGEVFACARGRSFFSGIDGPSGTTLQCCLASENSSAIELFGETPPERRLLVKSSFDRAATRSAILLSCM